jgi:hypothetical protein
VTAGIEPLPQPTLVPYAITGAAWLDPIAGSIVAIFAIHEGREAWEGELTDDH